MARAKDGRIGLSINAETIAVLDKVIDMLRTNMGVNASYTQAVQFVAHQYMINQREVLFDDNVTDSHSVPNEENTDENI